MTMHGECAARILRRSLATAIVCLSVGAWAAAPEKSSATAPASAADGFAMSIMSGTQLNIGKLSIGAGYMGGGPYRDEKNVRREGLHASIEITIEDDPSKFQQPDVHEGQIVEVAGYRILVEKIIPGNRGNLVLRLWVPPKPVDPHKNWFLLAPEAVGFGGIAALAPLSSIWVRGINNRCSCSRQHRCNSGTQQQPNSPCE